MKILFFGDSLTSAENNGFNGFVEKLNLKRSINYGVSGTTIGDYSLYPVGSTDLLSQIRLHESDIASADIIFLEYGSNDISSIFTGYVTQNRLYIDFIKAIDYINQLTNRKAKIYFLALGEINAKLMAKGQVNYLLNDYLKNINYSMFPYIDSDEFLWYSLYNDFKKFLLKNNDIEVIDIDYDLTNYISEDEIHPNDAGYQLIADCIKNKVKDLK